MRFGVLVQKDMVTAALGCLQILQILQQTNLSSYNIIKDKKGIGMDCAIITRAGENRSRGNRRCGRVVRAARLRC